MNKLRHAASDAFKEYWLEALLLAIAIGNAEVLREYLTSTGSQDVWQLTVAIYATEILIATVSMWGIPGLVLALVMFCTSLWSISEQFGDQAVGHAYFSISLFAGSVANYVRRDQMSRSLTKAFAKSKAPAVPGQAPQANPLIQFNSRGQLDPKPFLGMGARQLRDIFQLSHNKAKELREALAAGQTVTKDWLEKNRMAPNPQPQAVPGKPVSP